MTLAQLAYTLIQIEHNMFTHLNLWVAVAYLSCINWRPKVYVADKAPYPQILTYSLVSWCKIVN